jgi:hypothetical protein
LGLAITKQLVEMLGGEISFESVPNQGSTFRIRMPITCVGAATAGTNNGASGDAPKRKSKILLVDDNQMVRLRALLEMSGQKWPWPSMVNRHWKPCAIFRPTCLFGS